MDIPFEIKKALEILNNNNFEAYLVGGCVRDYLLKNIVNDYDITTSAKPDEILRLFSNYTVVETGIKHGTVTVIINKIPIEITTYRVDGEYVGNRRPSKVLYSKSLKEDTKRRDFTINALCFNEKIVDFHNGISDLENKIIRSVGNPNKRFYEDALRIMRAIRFSAILNFEIEENTKKAIFLNRNLIKNISAERILSEFKKIVESDNIDILIMYRSVFEIFIPEIYTNIEKINKCKLLEKKFCVRLSVLFEDLDVAEKCLKRLKFDNKSIKNTIDLIKIRKLNQGSDKISIKIMLNKYNTKVFSEYLEIAEVFGDDYEKIKKNFQEIILNREYFELKNLKIKGSDLIENGFSKGKNIGETLEYLLNDVITGKCLNEFENLLETALKLL